MVQQVEETGLPVVNGVSALSRGVLMQKKARASIHVNGDSMNTELLFQIINSFCRSASVYEEWRIGCYQLGSAEEEKGRAGISVDNKILTKLKPEEVQLLVSLPTRATGGRMPELVQSFDEQAEKKKLTQSCEKLTSNISLQPGKSTKFDQMGTKDGDSCSFMPGMFDFMDFIKKPKLWKLFPKAQSLDQFWKFIL